MEGKGEGGWTVILVEQPERKRRKAKNRIAPFGMNRTPASCANKISHRSAKSKGFERVLLLLLSGKTSFIVSNKYHLRRELLHENDQVIAIRVLGFCTG